MRDRVVGSVMTTPGQALSERQALETRTELEFVRMLEEVCAQVKAQALSALKGTVLTAAADPFAYTNVLATWRAATKELAERRADLVPSQVEELLAVSALPSMMHQDTVDLLRTSQEQGWSTYKTRVELGRLLTPRPASRTDSDYRAKHEAYKNAVRREARTAATYNYNSQAMAQITEPYKMWVSRLDAKTRPAHLEANGQVVPTSSEFIVGDERLAYPGDWKGSPAQTYNCRCVVVGKGEEAVAAPAEVMGFDEWDDSSRSFYSRLYGGTVNREYAAAIDDYMGHGFMVINDVARGLRPQLNPTDRARVTDKIKVLDRAMAELGIPTDRSVTVFRGSQLGAASPRVGDVYKDAGFLSTTANNSVAHRFFREQPDSWMMEITVPQGRKYIPGGDVEDEMELLFERNSILRVLSVDEDNRTLKMVMMS